jgi:RNA polymerase sigma-70 factor (ECF subfamily)
MSSGRPISESFPLFCGSDKAEQLTLESQIGALFDELHHPLFRYLLMLTWDAADTEDLVQDAFLRLQRHVQEGQPINNVKAWLFRVAYNLYIDRSRRTREAGSLSEPSVTRAAEEVHTRSTQTPEQRLIEQERHQSLARAIESLTQQQRHCLFLRREGFRYREIGQIIGIRESTVIDHLRRAIERLSKEVNSAR